MAGFFAAGFFATGGFFAAGFFAAAFRTAGFPFTDVFFMGRTLQQRPKDGQ